MPEIYQLDPVAANNNLAPPEGWPENMQYSEVNNAARELMAKLARFIQAGLGGTKLTTGTQPAYTLTTGQTLGAYAAGQVFAFMAHATSTGAVTLNVDTLGASAISDSRGNQLTLNDVLLNGVYIVVRTASAFRVIGHLTAATVQALTVTNGALDSGYVTAGTGNAYTATTGRFTSYVNGQLVALIPDRANTGAATINIDALGAETWVDFNGSALAANDVLANVPVLLARVAGAWRTIAGIPIDLATQVTGVLLAANGGTGTTTNALAAANYAGAGAGFGTVTALASAATTDLGTIAGHAVNVTGTTTITAFGSGANTNTPLYYVRFAGVLTITHNATSLICPDAVNISTAANDAILVEYLGSGNWRVVDIMRATPLISSGSVNVFTLRNNTTTPNTQLDFSWNEVVVVNTSGASKKLGATSFTLNAATTGINALDTGALAASTWYNFFIIANENNVAGLLSLSATAPTMPAGYTHRYRAGAVRTGAASTFLRTYQRGDRTAYEVITASTTPNLPLMITGASGNVDTTWTAVAIGAFVPPTAVALYGMARGAANSAICAPNNNYGFRNSTSNPPPVRVDASGASIPFEFILESTNIYYAGQNTDNLVACRGWVDAVNAN